MPTFQRWRIVRHGDTIYTVANARPPAAPFADQALEALAMLDEHLREAGSSRAHILSIQVLLADIGDRAGFDRRWVEWIGDDPAKWPQRAVLQAAVASGLLVELVVVAAADPAAGGGK